MKAHSTFKLATSLQGLAIAVAAAAVTACGGSDPSITVAGTAAAGAAIAGGSVVVSCATGSATASTDANGGYSVKITNGAGPCLITVTKEGMVLHSVIPGGGTVNVSPLTEMLVNYIATQTGASLANLVTNVNSKNLITTPAKLSASVTDVVNVLKTVGITLGVSDFLNTPIVPASAGTQSQTDKDLDALKVATIVDAATGLTVPLLSSTGAVNVTVAAQLTTDAETHPSTPTTGAN